MEVCTMYRRPCDMLPNHTSQLNCTELHTFLLGGARVETGDYQLEVKTTVKVKKCI